MPAGSSGNPQAQTLVAAFCLARGGSQVVDAVGHLPAVGALSATGVLDVSGFLPFP
jgi:hypothetical protein